MIDKKTKEKLKLIYKCRQYANKLIFEIEKEYGLEDTEIVFGENDFQFFTNMMQPNGCYNLSVKEMREILKSFIKAKKRGLKK